MKPKLDIPIIIPSVMREKKPFLLRKTLSLIEELYDSPNISVLAQRYSDEVINSLSSEFSKVEFIEKKEGFPDKISRAFQFCHDYMSERFSSYIFMEDDAHLIKNSPPLLSLFETVLKDNPRLGIVGALPKNLQRKKQTQ